MDSTRAELEQEAFGLGMPAKLAAQATIAQLRRYCARRAAVLDPFFDEQPILPTCQGKYPTFTVEDPIRVSPKRKGSFLVSLTRDTAFKPARLFECREAAFLWLGQFFRPGVEIEVREESEDHWHGEAKWVAGPEGEGRSYYLAARVDWINYAG